MNKIWNNKWMIAFLATAVLLVAAVTVAIVIGVSSKPTPPEYFEGDEVGVYYYDVADGEITLTLSGGNKFTLTGPRVNKTGTYTIDADGNITLDFIRDEDGNASATLNADKIALNYDGATMNFVKKINYTVSFQANGGSATDAATVVNGKTVNKPQDPVKAGYVFLGWYEDEALTKLFDFSSNTITADITLYARWIENPVGAGSYTVDFDLGYDNAPSIDAEKTINGILPYGAPTPTREGYTFAGWWISMYEDATKLSYAYTDGTKFTSNTTLYAAWTQTSGTKLASPMPSVEGNAISWSTVTGAISYKVTVVAPNGATVLNETLGATTVNFDFAGAEAGDFVISVVAVANDPANNSDATNRYVANKALDKVSYFDVIDGTLIFGSVKNATSYLVTVDCGNDAHDHTLFNNGASTSFSLINCPMQVGGIKITVVAQATGYASSTSETYVYDRTLSAVPSVIYDGATDAFIWDAVPAAKSYIVTLIVNGTTYNFDNGNKTTFSIAGYTGDIAIGVTPVNAGFNSPAATTATYLKTSPATPTGVTVNGTVVSWNASEGADSYIIKVGSITRTVNGTTYDLSAETLEIGVEYAISVQAVKSTATSSFSAPINYGYRKMAGELVYKNGVVSWTPVIGVSTYRVRVNGDNANAINVNAQNYTAVKLSKEGVNTIEVRFLDFGGSDWISLDVTAYAVTYMPRNGQSEYTEYLVPGDTMTLPRQLTYTGYDFTNWYSSPAGAAGNGKLYAAGSVFEEQGSIVLFADWKPITYQIALQTEGYSITNITNGEIYPATYTKHFTFPVPVTEDQTLLNFAGWFTGPAGSGTQLTDAKGNSVAPYGYTRDNIAYPFYDTGVLTFTLRSDNTYAVSAGPNINNVTTVTVPNTYNGLPVSTILENAFAYRSKLTTVNIPNSIKLVGTGAFTQCTSLTDIKVYEVEGNHDVLYFDHDGALLYKDLGVGPVYLEVFPRGKTGTYVMSDDVQIIRDKTFNYAGISKLVIGKGVTTVARYGFYYCKQLTEIEFADERTNSIIFDQQAFVGCGALKSLELPATFDMESSDLMAILTKLSKLDTIKVEQGNVHYGIRGQMLTNATGTQIIYCPRSYSGTLSVPVGTQEIGAKAFYGCTAITNIIVPAHVQIIGSEAFYGCTAAVGVTFEGNRRTDLTIGTKAFGNLKAAKTITFEGSTDGTLDIGKFIIGEKAFMPGTDSTGANVCDIQSVIFGDGANIEAIGAYAFAELPNLNSIVYGENCRINSIGDYAFNNVKKLRTIEIPSSTTAVGNGAFKGCANVAEINILEGAQEIDFGDNVFQDCTAVTKIYLPATVSDFNGSAFDGCNNIQRIEVSANNPHLWNDANGVLYRIDANKNPISLIFYPKSLVSANAGVVNNIPATVTAIEGSVFAANDILKEITIGKNVTAIGDKAFANCTSLNKVIFEDGRTALTIGDSAFSYCTALVHGANFTLPACTTSIGDYAFEYCKFSAFTLPEELKSIGFAAFQRNTSLVDIVIPLKVESIGDKAFNYCSKLKTFTVQRPTGDQTAANLTLGTIGSGISQTDGVFYNCSQLRTVDFGDRVTVIGDYVFYGVRNTNFKTITLSDKLVRIGMYAFFNTRFASITVPNTVEYIGFNAFAAQSASSTYALLKTIDFETGGTAPLYIESQAFYNQMNVTSITLPARTDNLGSLNALSGMKYYAVNTRFTGMSKLATINVEKAPEGTISKYTSINGVLYANDENGVPSILLFCPPANPGVNKTLVIPKEVREVNRYAFNNITVITTIEFEEYATTDENYGKPLLYIGGKDSSSTGAQNVLYGVFGGQATNTITSIKFPSHLAHIGTIGISETKNPLTLVFNPETTSVTIASRAFYQCKATSIDIKNVSSLGIYAFDSCKSATSINFTSKNLTSIPQYLFKDCSALQSYTVPAAVKTIGNSAFQGCSSLTTVTIEDGSLLETINDRAFFRCGKLSSINLSACKYLARLGTNITGESGVFQECNSLVNVDLSGCLNLVQIGTSAFKNCKKLETFVFPANIQTVGYDVLSNCIALTKVTLSRNFSPAMLNPTVLTDARSIFFGCTALVEVEVPENNPFFITDEYGAIYDKQKTIVYFFPAGADTTGYVIPSTVKEITPYAFAFYKGDSITLPEGLEVIGTGAFYFNNFETITIPATVRTIGGYAFTVDSNLKTSNNTVSSSAYELYMNIYDSNLKSVVFAPGSELNSLGDQAFYLAKKLVSINLPDSLEKIGKMAFYENNSLSEIILPASLKEISDSTFYECNNLSSITLQEGLDIIGYCAFSYIGSDVKGNISITVPSSVSTIDTYAFSYSSNINEIKLDPNGQLRTIGSFAFNNTSIEELVIPVGVNSYSSTAVQGISTLKKIEFTGSLIPEIGEHAFGGCTALETVILPAGLTTIGEYAFGEYVDDYFGSGNLAACVSLKSIVIPSSVTSIGNSAFNGCTALENVIFEPGCSVTNIGDSRSNETNVFKNTTNLKTVVLPDTVEVIGGHAFENSGVETINLPASLIAVGDYAFANCDSLVQVDLFNNVSYIGNSAFYDCDSLEKATPAFGTEYIGALAFGNCEKLTDAFIPATVTELVGNPYSGCIGLKSFTLDKDNAYYFMDEVGAMYDISGRTLVVYPVSATAKEFEIPDTVTTVASGAFAGASIEKLVIPARIVTIEDNTFQGLPNLTTVEIKTGITAIGDYAFEGCPKLNNVTIPSTVSDIGNYAFANCTSLDNIIFENTVADKPYVLGTHIFEGCTSMNKIVLPNFWRITEADASENKVAVFVDDPTSLMFHVFPSYMYANTGMVNPVIPKEIHSLQTAGVFANCAGLESVSFESDHLANIVVGTRFFYSCAELEELILPPTSDEGDPWVLLDGETFANCTSLKRVIGYHPTGTKSYMASNETKDVFLNCVNLEEVTMYKIMVIEETDDNFEYVVSGVIEHEIPAYNGQYKNMFKGCTSLKNFNFKEYTYLPPNMFEDCTSLNNLTVYNASFIGKEAFKNCTGMENVYFYLNYTWFGASVFDGWTADQNIYFVNATRADLESYANTWMEGAAMTVDEIFEGCEANIYFKDDILALDNINIAKFVPTVMNGDPEAWTPVEPIFKNLTADQTITFTTLGYADLAKVAGRAFFDTAAKIYDKDGYELVYNAVTTSVEVTDKDGKIIAILAFNFSSADALTTLDLASYADIKAVYLVDLTMDNNSWPAVPDPKLCTEVVALQNGLTEFAAFKGIAAGVKFIDVTGNCFVVDSATGLISEIDLYPSYYSTGYDWITMKDNFVSTLAKMSLAGLGENVIVRIHTQDYEDVVALPLEKFVNFAGCKATVIDMDGNFIFFDANGEVSKVLAPDGETVVFVPTTQE